MRKPKRLTFTFMFMFMWGSGVRAQETVGFLRKPMTVSVSGAVFLPTKIPYVTELMTGVDVRGMFDTRFGIFEADAFAANSDGVNYRTVAVDYHYELGMAHFPIFVLAGLHGDFYTPPSPNDASKFKMGWDLGGGFAQPLSQAISVREDFRYRSGPGKSILLGLGLSYQFSN